MCPVSTMFPPCIMPKYFFFREIICDATVSGLPSSWASLPLGWSRSTKVEELSGSELLHGTTGAEALQSTPAHQHLALPQRRAPSPEWESNGFRWRQQCGGRSRQPAGQDGHWSVTSLPLSPHFKVIKKVNFLHLLTKDCASLCSSVI